MALLAPQAPSVAGTTPAYVAANAGGDTVAPGDNVYLDVKNTDAATRTVTITAVQQCSQGSLHDLAVVIPATTGQKEIGPISGRFGRASDGLAAITYSAVTGVTIRAIQR